MSKQAKAMQRLIHNREGNEAYKSDEEKNPYASSVSNQNVTSALANRGLGGRGLEEEKELQIPNEPHCLTTAKHTTFAALLLLARIPSRITDAEACGYSSLLLVPESEYSASNGDLAKQGNKENQNEEDACRINAIGFAWGLLRSS
ncbi:hypothetical protein M378DRAFT_591539 [Amanita muscaria Koide BX008]|uniref:Uncharacterized protein n=1 Tax=Amanita muscaria (strain Koide BX008) TaxID=946122 RepID=A0A0C2WFV8_AMAMK|nr:hypothetical protein M378DRAFT_591539 [Amanita muscaria Koide BX008]